MPTPRAHGGAALQQFPLNLPGFNGLNKQARNAVIGPEWATRLDNTVLDTSNRIAARKGWLSSTPTAIAGSFIQTTEYLYGTARQVIGVTDNNTIWVSGNDGGSWTEVTGTATVTDSNMQLVLFNNVLLGFQEGGTVVQYSGTTFTDNTATGIAQGSVALAAFGRVWAKDGNSVVKYSALLDETDWSGTDAGTIDLTSVWQGQDEITALAEFNGSLVIFSKRNIIIYSDGAGSKLGIDPIQMYVADTVSGIGCIARDSIANVKGDLWFLDDTGLHSLGRLVQQKSNPLNNLSVHVQDALKEAFDRTQLEDVRAAYSPEDRFYIISLPISAGGVEGGVVFCFDTRGFLQDGSARCVGIWNGFVPTSLVVLDNLKMITSIRGAVGEVGTYTGFRDNGASYVFDYESGWTDLNSPVLKILKRITGLLFVANTTNVVFKWAFDFSNRFSTATVIYPGGGSSGEWGIDEWSETEWGAGAAIEEKKAAGRGTGEYIKVGMTVQVDSDEISCQQIALYAKGGRLK